MLKIQTRNKISPVGLDMFGRDEYEVASEIPNPDAILLRSYKLPMEDSLTDQTLDKGAGER